jgi:hypothetical protein
VLPLLDFPPILQREAPPALMMTSHISGGASKTQSSIYALDAAWRAARDLVIFENDRQDIFGAYGPVTRLVLAATEQVVHDPIADIAGHEAFDVALRNTTDKTTILYDGAAASLNRHTYVFDMLNVADRIAALGSYCVVFVPVSARSDLARESLLTFTTWRELLPAPHAIIPVVFHRDGDAGKVPRDHDLAKLVKRADDGVLVQPRVPMAVLTQLRQSGMKLCELADARNPLDTGDIAARIGIAPTLVELMRRCAGDALDFIDPQFERLGFQFGL